MNTTSGRSEYAHGTYLEVKGPWGTFSGGRVLCPDGNVRKLVYISPTADTWFSIPAAVRVRGKYISGYVTNSDISGESVVSFVPYDKNAGAFK